MAAATGAFAQSPNARAGSGSNVEIFGILDLAVNQIKVDGVVGNLNRLEGSGRNESSRLGFRGVEDLGGGWSAGFWLEAGLTVDDGAGGSTTINNLAMGDKITVGTTSKTAVSGGASLTGRQGLTFNRASTVSLIGKGVGEIRLGRDYNPTFWNMTGFDPFGTVGVGAATNVILGNVSLNSQISSNPIPSVRTSNAISWLSESMNGLRAQVMYAFSEVPSGCDATNAGDVVSSATTTYCGGQNGDGRTTALRLRYENGPLNVALATSKANYGDFSVSRLNAVQGIGMSGAIPAGTNVSGTTVPVLAVGGNSATNPTLGTLTTTNLGASYALGATRLFAQWGKQELGDTPIYNASIAALTISNGSNASQNASGRTFKYQLLGATHTMGAWTLKFSTTAGKRTETLGNKYNMSAAGVASTTTTGENGAKTSQNAVGFVYDLSKRTAVYGTYSTLKVTAGAVTSGTLRASMGLTGSSLAANGSASSTGIDIGIRHRF